MSPRRTAFGSATPIPNGNRHGIDERVGDRLEGPHALGVVGRVLVARVALIYGTSEGQTERIAHRIADQLETAGHDVDLRFAKDLPHSFDLAAYDGVVVGASVHLGTHLAYVTDFVRDHVETLNRLPSAFYSVSLTAAEGTEAAREPAREILDAFLATTGWEPTETATVAGALRYSQYGAVTRFLMRRIARKAGGGIDTSRDYEYTDWKDLEAFVDAVADHLP